MKNKNLISKEKSISLKKQLPWTNIKKKIHIKEKKNHFQDDLDKESRKVVLKKMNNNKKKCLLFFIRLVGISSTSTVVSKIREIIKLFLNSKKMEYWLIYELLF